MATRNTKTPREKAIEAVTAYKDKHPKANVTKLRAFLIANDHADNDKGANEILQACGLGGKRGRKGFRDVLYARLVEGPLGSDEFEKMIADESDNVRNHTKHYWAIVELANEIRAKLTPATKKAA